MPRIGDNILGCSIYIYQSRDDAERGRNSGGCGFIAGVPLAEDLPGWTELYAVTNSHVAGRATHIALNSVEGRRNILEVPDWLHHHEGQDLAACLVPINPREHLFANIPTSLFLTREIAGTRNIGAGDTIFMVGRLMNHEGIQGIAPVVRFGHVAMKAQERIHQPMRGFEQESFLVEATSIGGFSGSPVFVYTAPYEAAAGRGPGAWLLGVDWGHIRWTETPHAIDPRGDGIEEIRVPIEYNTGMSAVVPAWHVQSLLNDPSFVGKREQALARIRQRIAENGNAQD